LAYDVLYDNIGILAVPPQIGATMMFLTEQSDAWIFGEWWLPGGGSGIQVLDEATARASTSNWIPPDVKLPYSINWNFGVQHSFAKDFTAEIRYVGTSKKALLRNQPLRLILFWTSNGHREFLHSESRR